MSSGPALTPDLMLSLYRQGLFPMGDAETGKLYLEDPDPRAIIPLDGFHVSKTLAAKLRSRKYPVTFDEDFEGVIDACADRERTWLTPPLKEAYVALHRAGRAHSVEAWREGELAGGVYGVLIGRAFMAESMFHRRSDAGMAALAALVGRLRERGAELLDVQFLTEHLVRCGAVEIPRAEYLSRLARAVLKPASW